MNLNNKYKIVIASDVGAERDGIGVEVYFEGELLLEVFRDDTKKSRQISLFKNDIPLEVVEASIEEFKKEIPWEFQD
jgi:hypothetical protein